VDRAVDTGLPTPRSTLRDTHARVLVWSRRAADRRRPIYNGAVSGSIGAVRGPTSLRRT